MDLAQFPRRLVICGVPHVVKYVDKIKGEQGEITYGEYHQRDCTIEIAIAPQHGPESVWRTLLHEALHGVLYLSGQSQGMDEVKEEALVLALEYGLTGVISQLGGLANVKQANKKQG